MLCEPYAFARLAAAKWGFYTARVNLQYVYMKIVPILMLSLLLGTSQLAAQEIQHVGDFNNVTSSDKGEHCSGYSLELWKNKGQVFGLFDVHAGLCGDPPCGVIKDVKLDPITGAMSYQTSIQGQMYRFNGKLKANVVSGKVNGKLVRLAKQRGMSDSEWDKNLPAWCEMWGSVPRCERVKDMCASMGRVGGNQANTLLDPAATRRSALR